MTISVKDVVRSTDVSTTRKGRPGEWLSVAERRHVTDKSMARGLRILGAHYALYIATLVGAVAPLPIWANLGCAIANGALIGLIFLIGHDSGHASFVPGRRANAWITRLAFTPCLHSKSLWEVVHNRIHHGYTNLKGMDYVWAPMSKAEFDAASWLRQRMERIYRGPLGPVIYYWIEFWIKKLVLPIAPEARAQWRRHLPDTCYVIFVGGGVVALIGVLGHYLSPQRPLWQTMLVGWFIPFAIWNYLMALSIFLQHNHPQVPWFDKKDEWTFYNGNIRGSAHVDLPFDFLLLFKWVMLHNAHHALPSVPLYHLEEAQQKLIDAYGKDVVRYRFTIGAYRHIYKACKLFDYERKQWTDFNGVPTAEPIDLGTVVPAFAGVAGLPPRIPPRLPQRPAAAAENARQPGAARKGTRAGEVE